MQDLVPQTIDEQTILSYAGRVPASLMRELLFNGTPDEVIDQMAEWRDHGLRYLITLNASPLNPRLRKTLAANAPFVKILRGLKRL
jgi:phthiodiolone/phenolphthiodiolone dimycocerosates ketoreductase